MLVHVLIYWLGTVLLVQILQIHPVHRLARVAARHLQLVHLGRMHLRVIGVEGPREVADHLLAHVGRCWSVRRWSIFWHHHVLICVVGRCATTQVHRVVRLLGCCALIQITSDIELLLGSGVLVALDRLRLVR